jgi:acetylornithine/succinyldiaminopimelate/putrescine aminotransferase
MNPRELFLRHVGQTSPFPLALEVERAQGVYLYGPKGERWLDLIAGIAVSSLGHSHPRVVQAVQEQAARYLHTLVYGELVQAPQVALATRLAGLLPAGLDQVFFVNSGSEAVEGALKLAKRYTGRTELVGFQRSYYGSTHGALSLGGAPLWRDAFLPLLPDVRRLDFGDFAQLEQISTRTAAVLTEVIQAEAGVRRAPPGYLHALRARCDATGTLLMFDESQTGLGRSGAFLACQREGVLPDVLVLSKALGGGLPLGAFVSSPERMRCLTHDPILGHITTFGGHPLSCAAGLAALETLLDEGLMERVAPLEARFRERLSGHPAVRDLRSFGLLMALDLGSESTVQQLIAAALKAGLLSDWFLYEAGSIRIAPPLLISDQEVAEACDILLHCLDNLQP